MEKDQKNIKEIIKNKKGHFIYCLKSYSLKKETNSKTKKNIHVMNMIFKI
jgi:hypothetical protein